jgi:hypothetical protein
MTIGYVYKIVCLDPEVKDTYVGSCSNMTKRRCKHKSDCNNLNSENHNLNVYNFIRAHGGWSNWSMIAIEQVNYTIKHELLIRERFHLEHLKASLNKRIPSRTDQEYYKTYYETNKEQISERRNQKITCACGKISSKNGISTHKKSRYHQNYLEGLPEIVITEVPRTIVSSS